MSTTEKQSVHRPVSPSFRLSPVSKRHPKQPTTPTPCDNVTMTTSNRATATSPSPSSSSSSASSGTGLSSSDGFGSPSSLTLVNVNVDMSESFCEPTGLFYCGTSEAELSNAAKVARESKLVVYTCDAHPALSPEFTTSGGPFPPHHVVARKSKSTSPKPATAISDALRGRRGAVLAPRHTFFQTGRHVPDFTIAELEESFGYPWLSDSNDVLGGDVDLIVSAKSVFNGAMVHTVRSVADTHFEGVPCSEDNAFTILREKFGLGSGVHFAITGCVLSICVYQTASGVKQMFPLAKVSIVLDACTALNLPQDEGAEKPTDWEAVLRVMSEPIGVEITTIERLLGKQ